MARTYRRNPAATDDGNGGHRHTFARSAGSFTTDAGRAVTARVCPCGAVQHRGARKGRA